MSLKLVVEQHMKRDVSLHLLFFLLSGKVAMWRGLLMRLVGVMKGSAEKTRYFQLLLFIHFIDSVSILHNGLRFWQN